jgi:prepilin-type processing-associated H-X9-DG protein
MLLQPGPWAAKLSVTQWNDAGIRDRKLYLVPPYAPDGNPDTYYFIMEDWHDVTKTDYDYDISIKVTENNDGTTTLVFKQHGTGASYQVLDLEDGTVLKTKADMDGGANGTIVVNTVRPGETNYGMNKYARDVGGAGGKILVMDYLRLEAKTTDLWAGSFFDPAQSGVPIFARHFGQANVLFSDGSVQPERPVDLDPIAPTAALKWWMP